MDDEIQDSQDFKTSVPKSKNPDISILQSLQSD